MRIDGRIRLEDLAMPPAPPAQRGERIKLLRTERPQIRVHVGQAVTLGAVGITEHRRQVPQLVMKHERPRYEVVHAHGAMRHERFRREGHVGVNLPKLMVGQRLGAGRIDEARDVDRKLLFLTVSLHVLIGGGMILASPYIPRLYNVIPEVRTLTSRLLVVAGLSLPIHSFAHATYFTIRSGGRTVITFLFDAVYTWAVTVLLAFCLCRFTNLEIVKIYFCVQFIDVIKVVLGLLMLRSDFWARNVVSDV